jgi:hypothetical protein
MLRPTQTRVHAPGGRSGGGRAMRSGGRAVRSAGASRIPTRREANRPCARRCCWKPCCWEKACCSDAYSDRQPGCGERACRQRVQGRRSVTVCCRSASRRRSTVACCAGKRIAVNSSRAQTLEAARAWRARASLRCNLRRRCGGPRRASGASPTRLVAMLAQEVFVQKVSAANGLPVSRSQRHTAASCQAAGCTAAGRAPFGAVEGRRADSRRPHCRRDIWWRIG